MSKAVLAPPVASTGISQGSVARNAGGSARVIVGMTVAVARSAAYRARATPRTRTQGATCHPRASRFCWALLGRRG
eukprot:11192678-Lingulodinium_polyedra.AAC.1